jgi:hypothetical protein
MTFLAPMMLVGAAAVAVPVALHFFYRARYKPLPWAPMKFLKEAIEQTSRRLKFQEWILLALRCLAIILLAVAIARPGWTTATVAGRGEAIDAVFVFDTSMSMGADDGEGKTRLDRAKAAALDVLRTLPPNSSIQVYACADRVTFLGPMQRFNTDQAAQLIPNIEPTSLPSDLLPGLSEALSAAESGTSPAKEIYVFTDMQKEAFERQQGAVKAKCEEIKDRANLVFVRCGNSQRKVPNVAVADVTWISDIPHTRTRVPFVITLKNTGAEPVKGLKVALEIDGKAVEKDAAQVDQIDPGATNTVTLTGGLDTPGVRVVGVAITGDSLPGDNVLYKTILVRDKVRVLLVDGTPKPENPTGAGDHFVKTALNPGRVKDYYIETESVSATEASVKDLDGKDIVYLLNAPIRGPDPVVGMSAEFLSELTRFVKAGGGLVVAGGDLVNPDEYNKRLGSGGAGLLPFDIAGIRSTTETAPFYPAAEKVEETSFLGQFRKQPFADALQRVALFSMLDLKEPGPGRVLVRTTDNKPYIASRAVEAGEVIQIAGALDETWGNFSSDPGSYHVPLAVFTVTHLTGRKVAGGTATAGNPLVWFPEPDAGTAFELVKPAEKRGDKLRPRTKLEAADPNVEPRRSVTTADTAVAGVYHIVPLGKGDESGPVFTVNPDLRESANMAVAREEDVEGWLGFKPGIVHAGADTEAAVTSLRTQSEWTEYVLIFLLVLLVAEAAWAWVCGRAW